MKKWKFDQTNRFYTGIALQPATLLFVNSECDETMATPFRVARMATFIVAPCLCRGKSAISRNFNQTDRLT